jgi:hypothetical protein
MQIMRTPVLIACWLAMLASAPWTAAAEPAKIPPKKDFLIFLLAGQSNMAGRGKPVEEQDRTPHPRVLVFTQEKQWQPAADPLHFDKPAVVGVGLGTTFAKTLAEALPGKTIGLVPVAFGGSQIAEWAKGARHYDNAMDRAKAAMADGTLAGILWHQGESDAKADRAPLYQAKLDELVKNFRSDLSAPEVPFICGTLADSQASSEAAKVNAALRKLPERVGDAACVEAKGLTMAKDNIHFDVASYRELGRRYAAAWLELAGETVKNGSIGRLDNPWKKHVVNASGRNATAVAADFTGDGRVDVIATFSGASRLFIAPDWREMVLHQGPARGWSCIHSEVMDVDEDGDVDYIGAIPTSGVFWLENPGAVAAGGWSYHNIDNEIHGIHATLAADVNGDGKLDLLVNNFEPHGAAPNSLCWLERPSGIRNAPAWTRHVLADGDAPGGNHYFGFGDVDGDGLADVAMGAKGETFPHGNWFAWWKRPRDANQAWSKQVIAENQPGATNVQPADLNGDRKVDFFASRGHGRGVVWFEGPDWTPHEVDPTLDRPHCLAIGDIDGDGDIDAATCARLDKLAVWYENDGRGGFSPRVIGRDQSAYDIRLVDMDADGDRDLLIAGEASANIVWYENPKPTR